MLFEVLAVVFFVFLLNSLPCTKVKHICFGGPWEFLMNYNVIVHVQILTVIKYGFILTVNSCIIHHHINNLLIYHPNIMVSDLGGIP